MDKIKKHYKLEDDLLFQQVKDRRHKSKESMEAFEIIYGKNEICWKANSPDLSLIETVLSILKLELKKRKIHTLKRLKIIFWMYR